MDSALSRSPAEILLRIPLTGDGGGVPAAVEAAGAGADGGAGVTAGGRVRVVSACARAVSGAVALARVVSAVVAGTVAGARTVSGAAGATACARTVSAVAGAGGGDGLCAPAIDTPRTRTTSSAAGREREVVVIGDSLSIHVRWERASSVPRFRAALSGNWAGVPPAEGYSPADRLMRRRKAASQRPGPIRFITSSITGSRPAP